MVEITVDAASLHDALAQMRKLGKRAKSDADWTVLPDRLRLAWGGMDTELIGEGSGEVHIRMSGTAMKNLDQALPRTGALRIRHDGERLHFGTFSIAAPAVAAPVPNLVPVKARPVDLLALPFRCTAEEIYRAGLTSSVAEVNERLQRNISRACESLAWLGINEGLLNTWIRAHLEAVSRGEETFEVGKQRVVVVDKNGQLLMSGSGVKTS